MPEFAATDGTIDVLIRTAMGEARGEGLTGIAAVLNVIINRALHPRWWGSTPVDVCLEPWQFSCWNINDPNRAVILALNTNSDDLRFVRALAVEALALRLPDKTGGADSYFDRRMPVPPSWAARAAHTVTIGNHEFYRVELAAESTGLPDAPPISAQTATVYHANVTASQAAPMTAADALNQEELDALAAGITVPAPP